MFLPQTRFGLAVSLLLLGSFSNAADYYTSIRPIIETKCNHCHSGTGVSFAFGDLEGAYGFRAAMANAVAARRMPPWMAAPGVQNYQHDLSLSTSEIAQFSNWAKAGYPLGDKLKYRAKSATKPAFKADLTLEVPSSKGFLPNQAARDDYRCFLVDWPVKTTMYVRGLELKPGNLKISHHAILYAVEGTYRSALMAMDNAEEEPGYRCFGGPLPDRFGDAQQKLIFEKGFPDAVAKIQASQFWLSHWAPGMDGYTLPPDTGMLVKPGSVLILQMHYYTGFAQNQRDSGTKIGVMLSKSVKKPAFNWPLSNSQWLEAQTNKSLVVPPMQNLSVSEEVSFAGLDQYLSALSGVPMTQITGLELHSANLHMHLIGASGRVTLFNPTGKAETLLNVPRYEFGWQRDFVFTQPKIIPKSDLGQWRLKVECTFANSGATPVFGGYGSDQEMCYNFSYIAVSRKP